ncbi:hypothetical protein O988_09740, partial [Pseudogymnoascus sp. VKM F-3808]
ANNLDDVFGSAPSSPTLSHATIPSRNNEPSEVPRLRSAHSTAGYRDGLTTAKGTTIQEGFDEGYGLGATMGLRIGAVLGTLEGIWAAFAKADAKRAPAVNDGEVRMGSIGSQPETERLRVLVVKARSELRTEGVFGRQYWGEDGIWVYDVQENGGGWKDVVDAHPLIQSWEAVVAEEVAKVRLDTGVMDRTEVKRHKPRSSNAQQNGAQKPICQRYAQAILPATAQDLNTLSLQAILTCQVDALFIDGQFYMMAGILYQEGRYREGGVRVRETHRLGYDEMDEAEDTGPGPFLYTGPLHNRHPCAHISTKLHASGTLGPARPFTRDNPFLRNRLRTSSMA